MHHTAWWLTRHPSSLYGVVDSSTTSGRTDQKEIYVEVIRETLTGGGAGPIIRRDVPYLLK